MRPQDARRDLRTMWESVYVKACADGSLKIIPKWRKAWKRHGVFTRLYAAYRVADVLTVKK